MEGVAIGQDFIICIQQSIFFDLLKIKVGVDRFNIRLFCYFMFVMQPSTC